MKETHKKDHSPSNNTNNTNTSNPMSSNRSIQSTHSANTSIMGSSVDDNDYTELDELQKVVDEAINKIIASPLSVQSIHTVKVKIIAILYIDYMI